MGKRRLNKNARENADTKPSNLQKISVMMCDIHAISITFPNAILQNAATWNDSLLGMLFFQNRYTFYDPYPVYTHPTQLNIFVIIQALPS